MLSPECPIARQARISPEGLAVVDRGRAHDFRSYHAAVGALAAMLDLPRGARVGICAPASYAVLCLLHALWRRGVVAVPVSPRLPAAARAQAAADLELVRLYGDWGCGGETEDGRRAFDLEATVAASVRDDGRRIETPALVLEAPAAVILTSGSTAKPKAVVHSFGSLACNALGANENMPLGPTDRWLLSLPLHHVSGLGILMRTALAGAAVVIDAEADLPEALRMHGITHVSVVSTQLSALLASWKANGPMPALRAVLAGGSAIPERLVTVARELGVPLHLSYGSTEMGSQITTTAAGAVPDPGSSGELLRGREAAIAADGEILVRGETLCAGYLVDGRLQPCTDEEGWFHTGDRGHIDANGSLHVHGRGDTMFISGGENIYPEEIEAALLALAGVDAATVIDVPSEEYGARPVAVVKMSPDAALDGAGIRAALAARLPRFKIPDAVLGWPEDDPAAGVKPDRPFLRKYVRESLGSSTAAPRFQPAAAPP